MSHDPSMHTSSLNTPSLEQRKAMAERLLPCPFCGARGFLTRDELHWSVVQCEDCGGKGPCIDLVEANAVERWNTRADLLDRLTDGELVQGRHVPRVEADRETIARETITMFAQLGCPDGRPAYFDLEPDTIVFMQGREIITAGDIRALQSYLRSTGFIVKSRTEELMEQLPEGSKQ